MGGEWEIGNREWGMGSSIALSIEGHPIRETNDDPDRIPVGLGLVNNWLNRVRRLVQMI